MKKNITSIIIMALVCLNVILSGIIMFVMVPSLNKVNTLVTKVTNAVDLDLGNLEQAGEEELSIADKTNYTLEEGSFKGTLKSSGDSKMHYVAIDSINFTLNNKAASYSDVNANIASYETSINDVVSKVFGQYTVDEVENNLDAIRTEILNEVSALFANADCFVSVTFSNLVYQ